uniref:Putative ovule protein n=1 Tax=Solanum chacoense TaxID=4108 RepID=A0A0V0HSF3_SOLCH
MLISVMSSITYCSMLISIMSTSSLHLYSPMLILVMKSSLVTKKRLIHSFPRRRLTSPLTFTFPIQIMLLIM